MALSPNYGWAEPDNSSLVKNGAQDIRALGDAIDTSLWNVGYGQAGKNKIINGDFSIWQRGTTVTPASGTYGYGADRWRTYSFAATSSTLSQQSFTAGAAPVAGYEAQYFARFASTNTATYASQPIEDVRTFAGQPVTVSFWAKSASAQTLSSVKFDQNFGSGGSSTVTTSGTAPAITTSWARYSVPISVPSISGKTIGTSSNLDLVISGAINNNLDLWGVQVEYGSKATPFETATGTLQGELAACQRYFVQLVNGINQVIGNGSAYSASEMDGVIYLPVPMRTAPTAVQTTGTDYWGFVRNGGIDYFNSLTVSSTGAANYIAQNVYNATEISSTAGNGGFIRSANASTSFALSAEL